VICRTVKTADLLDNPDTRRIALPTEKDHVDRHVLDGETMDHGAIVPARGDVEIKGIFLGIAAERERSFTR
jgi:hypothetical protein